jgi:hypothetical protein
MMETAVQIRVLLRATMETYLVRPSEIFRQKRSIFKKLYRFAAFQLFKKDIAFGIMPGILMNMIPDGTATVARLWEDVPRICPNVHHKKTNYKNNKIF